MHTGFVIGIAVAFVIAGAATAGPYEDGVAAYEHGDYAKALRLLRPLAEQGNATAELHLGSMYHEGEGVPQDYTASLEWWSRAAGQGLAEGQFNLGLMYRTGQGVPQDDAEAVKWLQRAAWQGLAEAQTALGNMYAQLDGPVASNGLPRDYVQAHMWFNLAGAHGDAGAVSLRDTVARRMTPDQIAEAQRLAREWNPKPER
jgi:TPR repeat protein